MIKVGITGQNGFIGGHLYNTLGLATDEFERVTFERDWFDSEDKLNHFVANCDVIVHLAAMNRHTDANVIYDNNVTLVKKLVNALDTTQSKAHVLFSSSSQEERDNLYGQSKKSGREDLAAWAARSGGKFTGLIIPNVFGPFGVPYYNSFIATFCHQLTHNEQPKIDVDGNVKLIYVAELAEQIIKHIKNATHADLLLVEHTTEQKVSDILNILEDYKSQYLKAGILPNLDSLFKLNLFNTFRSYIDIRQHFPVKFVQHTDPRGTFVEVVKLNIGGQVSFSTTVAGITRGNHYHTRKIERFAVIKGEALIQLRKIGTDDVIDLVLSGTESAYVDMPVWYTHNIKNIGTEELYTIFWINEFFNQADPDTYFENV